MAAANKQIAVSDELNYETWAPIAQKRLEENGVWDVVVNGVPSDPTKIPELAATIKAVDLAQWRNRVIKDMKALKIMQSSLPDSAFRKSLSVASAKALWDLLKKGNEEAKLRRLEKEFENLTMHYGESMECYLKRVWDILDRLRISRIEKSDDELVKKLLTSLSREYDDAIPVLNEFMEMPDMTYRDLLTMYERYGDPPKAMPRMVKDFCVSLAEEMWCGFCKKHNHNEEDCYYNNPMARNSSGGARRFTGQCHHCGERGHYARHCSSTRNQQQAQKDQKSNVKFDEDMWMIYSTATSHMTPYVRFFTTLDRTFRDGVSLASGKVVMAEGKGDVSIIHKGVKKTIKNVLFVPGINRNVLSVGQMTSRGYTVTMGGGECVIKEKNGKVFAKTIWEERGFALRLQVIHG
ncbi:unnamed protein product [Microthlaspi erraticum]|uniref:CCHC-type domain-containing protein n=1 Tax=Microthlaspi erraticum TaxID=1685480 RepID=A0A6D2HB47_9BRAS|nr:unnamed protein product [Microthlaspi erraticum]